MDEGTAPSDTMTAGEVVAPFFKIQFFTAELAIGIFPVDPNKTTSGLVVPVLVMVRSWDADFAPFEPSMMV